MYPISVYRARHIHDKRATTIATLTTKRQEEKLALHKAKKELKAQDTVRPILCAC